MAVSNIIEVEFGNLTMVETKPCYQYDYGQKLKFTDLSLPSTYEVHFSNNGTQGIAYTQIGDSDGVIIPDTLFQTGKPIYVFIYLHNGENDGHTAYVVRIPIMPRAKPTSYVVPTPEEQSALADAISAIEKMSIKIQQMEGGATPPTADSVAKMTKKNQIYIYTGSEPDYIFGNWYYYDQNTAKWETGGQYASGIIIDPTLTQSGQAADAKVTGKVKNGLNTIVYGGDYDYPIAWIDGYYINNNNGEAEVYTNWICTDFIEIDPNAIVKTTTTATNGTGYNAFYDADKTFLQKFTNANSALTIPNNAKYMRLSCRKTEKVTVLLAIQSGMIDFNGCLAEQGDEW